MTTALNNYSGNVGEPAVTCVQPFNPEAFERAVRYFAARSHRPLTKLDLLKLHVLADFYHLLAVGRQMIGGELFPWQHGPVNSTAYHRVGDWIEEHDRSGQDPEGLAIDSSSSRHPGFTATTPPPLEDFSEVEQRAMDRALTKYLALDEPHSVNSFFHGASTWFGRVWRAGCGQPAMALDLLDLLESYASSHPDEAERARAVREFLSPA